MEMNKREDFGAFKEKFTLHPSSDSPELPLHALTFAIKDIFDVKGYVTGFGNPDWARTHDAAVLTAPSVLAVLEAGATSVGKTIMDEMAYSIDGINKHYGTPVNPIAPDRIPGGSSSGSAVAVAAELVDFSFGTDTGGSVRVPAAFCGILGFRPSQRAVSTVGVIPMVQSTDTVGWFARDPIIFSQVGHVLLQLPEIYPARPSHIILADDCFNLLSIPSEQATKPLIETIRKVFGLDVVDHIKLGDYVGERVLSLKHFMSAYGQDQENIILSLQALSDAYRLLERFEFKNNHGEWINAIKPNLGPGIFERVSEALQTTEENVDTSRKVMVELRAALSDLLKDSGILAIPTVPGPPSKLDADVASLQSYRARAFSLLAISGMSGLCQVSIPLGMYNNLPVSVSLLANHGRDKLLLNTVKIIYGTLKEQAERAND